MVTGDLEIVRKMAELVKEGKPFALATIIEVEGSSPGKPGFKMLVTEDGKSIGTVGGGSLEEKVKKVALDVLKDKKPRKVEIALTEEEAGGVGMLCGGKAVVFIDVIGKGEQLIIVGGGHLAEAITRLAKTVGFQVTVVDPYATTDRFPNADLLINKGPEEALPNLRLDESTYMIILGEHEFDVPSLKVALKKPVPYVGMIGSRKRVAAAFKEVLSLGFDRKDLERVYAPVGLDIGAETPEEIAISILSEILSVKKKGSCKHMREVKGVAV
jgi:xanthine dehydrogenase accessory factor